VNVSVASAALRNRPNTVLEATGHSVRFVAGEGLYRVARASTWAFGSSARHGKVEKSSLSNVIAHVEDT
jgi:hypothetical protein